MKLQDDDFTLFGVPANFAQDRAQLDTRWRQLQAQVHPDRFAAEGAAAQRVAMQWAVRVNEAYARLKDPLARAQYLCELRGAPIDAERNTSMPAAFLMQQMQWREALDEAGDVAAIDALDQDVARHERDLFTRLAHLLDEQGDAAAAAQQVRALMFVQRFRADLSRRLDALDP
ncbi:MAG: Fe-S protein assembly co-chaperone HscB [Burkholderiales bacterium]|nr:Fe-S protein assembly co-chaperone HscB [Burkholderiales bacterium]